MEALIIEATPKTPRVILDPVENHFEISGMSLPENVVKHLLSSGLMKIWACKGDPIVFKFKLDYLNSASAKMISVILTKRRITSPIFLSKLSGITMPTTMTFDQRVKFIQCLKSAN